MKLTGMVPPIGTPLNPDETVDEKGLRKLVNYLLDGGVSGIFVNGSMGCFALLTDAEQIRAIEIVADAVNGRVPVVAGVSDSGTKRVIDKLRIVEKFQVDYLTAVVPYFFKLTQQQGKRFFQEVANAAQKPVLIYNNPYLTPLDFEVATLLDLAEEPNIAGLKDSNQDFNRLTGLFEAFRGKDDFSILLGTELLIPQGLMMGADGAIGGAHNIAPRFAAELYQAHLAGDYETAFARSRDLAKICEIFQYGSIWGGFEAALQLLGICEKTVFEPYAKASAEDKEKVRGILLECGLLANESLAQRRAE